MLLLGEVLNDAGLPDYSMKVLVCIMFALAIILTHFSILVPLPVQKYLHFPQLFITRINEILVSP